MVVDRVGESCSTCRLVILTMVTDELDVEAKSVFITGWVHEKKYSVEMKLLTRSVDSVNKTVTGIDGVTLVEQTPKNVQYPEMVWLASDTLKQPVKDCSSLSSEICSS